MRIALEMSEFYMSGFNDYFSSPENILDSILVTLSIMMTALRISMGEISIGLKYI